MARGAGGQREIPARDFFTGPLQTALRPGELLTAVRFPAARPGDGFAFEEVARRHGDFAICGVMAAVHRENHQVTSATVGLFGVGDRPVAVNVTEAVTAGTDAREIGRQVADGLSPSDDFHASASYRRRLAAALTGRCLDRVLREKKSL
jgi:CO/xanthine dehydrogenase FAD-binding subunit